MSEAGKLLAVQARIQTARVEIKALTVGGKQMTQAVFRQLRHEDLIDPKTLTLRGQPWGWVNHCFPICGSLDRHLDVVWQLGQELRRDTVYAGGWKNEVAELGTRCQVVTDRLAGLMARAVRPEVPQGGEWVGVEQGRFVGLKRLVAVRFPRSDGEFWQPSIGGELASAIRSYWLWRTEGSGVYGLPTEEQAIEALDREIDRFRDELVRWGVATAELDDISLLWRWRDAQIARQESIKAGWERLYATLKGLDQLFIAV